MSADPATPARLAEARRLDREGQHGRAVLAYKLVLRADPGCLEAQVDLAGLLLVLGRYEESLALSREALEARPGLPAALQNLIGALLGLEQYAEAEAHCRDLLRRVPDAPAAHLGLGLGLASRDLHLEAEPHFARVLALDPGNRRARLALWTSRMKARAWDRALATWLEIAERDMTGAEAVFERGLARLTCGDLREGFRDYEARWADPPQVGPVLDLKAPRWDGTPFPGRTLLLHYEQGFGDTLMALRYAGRVKALGGAVAVQVQPQLLPVVRSCAGVDQWLVPGDPLPPHDLHLPLMSLPHVFGGEIPAEIPYLRAPAAPSEAEARVAGEGLRVGLVWAGSTGHRLDALRTLPPEALAPLFRLPGIAWHSLQVGWEGGLPDPALRDLAPWLKDFGDTARVIERLDLVLAVDTAVAHLAGALGKPVWLMLPLIADWRWRLEGETTPWYPAFRLFRQIRYGDWADVGRRVGESLNHLMNIRRGTC